MQEYMLLQIVRCSYPSVPLKIAGMRHDPQRIVAQRRAGTILPAALTHPYRQVTTVLARCAQLLVDYDRHGYFWR